MYDLKFKRLHPDAILPTRATDGSAALDLYYCDTDIHLFPNERCLFSTGWAAAIPKDRAGFIWPRSGMGVKAGIDRMAGLIDSDYRGEIRVLLINHSTVPLWIEHGQRIAQLVIGPIDAVQPVEVDELDDTERGADGFGSTGS